MSSHIAVFCIPAHGHMRPALAVTEELVRRGHRVTFVAPEGFTLTVRETGASVVPYTSPLAEAYAALKDADLPPDHLAWYAVMLQIESEEVIRAAEEHFTDDLPDLLFHDMSLAFAGRALGTLWNRPAVQSTPAMASNAHYWEFGTMFAMMGFPEDHPAVPELFRRASEFAEERALSVSTEELLGWQMPVEGVVYAPRAFQTAEETFGDETAFVGPCFLTEDLTATWDTPQDGTPQDDTPLVVISMGTLSHAQSEFFRTCVRALTGQPWRAVITVGNGFDTATLGTVPPNIEVYPWVPQVAVLEHADAFVTSGGLGSLMGAVHTGTPMLMAPHLPEHRITCERAAELGLGELLDPGEATEEHILATLQHLITDEATRTQLRRMRELTEAAGGAARAADVLESRIRAAR
ncbi:macrolide family glycosyltransferase [Streptomyces sp. NPDC015125]|uniref:macrolide family glycosyltransferase n=1 Tax=Streptomyces sp. NPDC015125 TaxID=3364938 RepID=UPI0036F9E1FC